MIVEQPGFWLAVFQIIWIDILLSGDNAVVIALAVRSLPRRQQWWGRIWGTVGAVVLRLMFLAVITVLFEIPFLKLVGGLVLIWIAVKLVRPQEESSAEVRGGASLWEAVWIIMVADVTMSLDNVLAVAGAAAGDFRLLIFGIAISLPLVVFGSGIIGWFMSRWVWIVWLGGGILGWVAGEMITSDTAFHSLMGAMAGRLHVVVPLVLGAGLTLLGWWFARRQQRPETRHA
jgi:YjbE family integral membrane protein